MIKPSGWTGWRPHVFIECRSYGAPWWLFAHPVVGDDARMSALLASDEVDHGDASLRHAGLPADTSVAVLDEYTWRVAGAYGGESGNIVGVDEAASWLRRGVSTRWSTAEPFARVTDPRWEHATWMTRRDVHRLILAYERQAGLPAPATWCALEAMMRALERDYTVRLVAWLERVYAATDLAPLSTHRDDAGELEEARRFVHRAGARR